jgi:1,4-dihydroxy-2-naphthoate octaprenyltransferase
VAVAVGVAASEAMVVWRAIAALVVAVSFQIGVNYANDYFDGLKGVDTPRRLGPPRLVAQALASSRAVALAAGLSFLSAGLAGLALAVVVDLRLLALGVVALLAAVGYSGGPKPYGGLGLGELSVFLFFGLMAVAGTSYVMDRQVGAAAWWASVAIGILAVALLVANNLRDIPTDSASGKRTLAVRLGANRTRHLYLGLLVASYLVVIGAVIAGAFELPTLAVLITFPLAARAGRAISAEGRELIAALQSTAALHAGFGLFLAGGLWLS